jgi:hypothetical protein
MVDANDTVEDTMYDTGGWLSSLCAAALFLTASHAFAAHPSLTEDTGTQGENRFELELALEQERDGDARSLEFGPQLSYGLTANLDLILRPTWLDNRASAEEGRRHERGIGDTTLDFKWRFLESDAMSFGVRAGVDLPTGSESHGLGSGTPSYHGLLIATFDAAPWSFSVNAGCVYHEPTPEQRRDTWVAAAGAVWVVNEGLKITSDVGVERNADPSRSTTPAVARIGAIYTINQHWDIDVGYQSRLNDAAPRHLFLAGATLRW